MHVFKIILVVSSIFVFDLRAESFVISKPKKQPKVDAQDCCQQILREVTSFARISQYLGQIESMELQWIEDFFNDEKDALFKKASQSQLQEYMLHKQKYNALQEEFERALQNERDFLKQFEQQILFPSKKK